MKTAKITGPIMQNLFLAFFAAVLAGCAMLEPFHDEAADAFADAIDEYCKQTDIAFREKFRDDVNSKTDHAIEIKCQE